MKTLAATLTLTLPLGVAALPTESPMATIVPASPAEQEFQQLFDARALWDDYPDFRRSPEVPQLFVHADLERFLAELERDAGDLFEVEVLTRSEEGRTIHHLTCGTGPTAVQIWARQHGDEALCSAALMDFLGFVADRRDTPLVQTLLSRLTLHIVPMVNPDGVERLTRHNAMGIDPNRDARLLQTPSGRALRMIFERYSPEVCFNLHDQEPRKSTDDTGELIGLSYQACPFDREETLGPQLLRAKQICGVMLRALSPWLEGHIARYEADYMSRAFGDSMSRWGVASILIESGGWFGPAREAENFVVRGHLLSLLAGLTAVATGAERGMTPAPYDALPLEGNPHFDLLIRNTLVLDGTGLQPHQGDIGVNRRVDEREGGERSGTIRDVGDMSIYRGREEIDGAQLIATGGLFAWDPAFTPVSLADRERVMALLRRGVTTVIGTSSGATPEERHVPTEATPIRALFFETLPTVAAAAERDFLTSAAGIHIPWRGSDLLLVNRGRVPENHLMAIGMSEHPASDVLLRAFGEWTSAEVLGAAWPSATAVLLGPASDVPSLLVSGAVTAPIAFRGLTAAPAVGLDLTEPGGIWRGEPADLLLWERAGGSADDPGAIRLGALREVIVAGFRVPLD